MKKQIIIIALSLGAIALGTNQIMAQSSERVSTSVNIILKRKESTLVGVCIQLSTMAENT